MYSGVSQDYLECIHGSVLRCEWSGTVRDAAGVLYSFGPKDISHSSGSLTLTGADSTALKLGAVYTSQLGLGFMSLVNGAGVTVMAKDFDRYRLYGGEIVLNCLVSTNLSPVTWADVADFDWNDMFLETWEDQRRTWLIPMGRYTIAETQRNLPFISVKAYDRLSWFDKEYRPSSDDGAMLPFDWLSAWCAACGVPLGMTSAEVHLLPNGSRYMALAIGAVDDVTTYRDALSYLAEALCCIVTVDRDGALVLRPFGVSLAVTDIPASWRWDCLVSDYQTYYNGLYATYKEGGVSEYYGSAGTEGLVYNISVNPFLQFTDAENRAAAFGAIIGTLSAARYTPFSATAPCDPALDLFDVVTLSGNLARGEYALITEVVFSSDGTMRIKCVGENPKLNVVSSRYSKNIEGLIGASVSGASSGTQAAWILVDTDREEEAVGDDPVLENAIEFESHTDYQKLNIQWTGNYSLSVASLVTVSVDLDGEQIYCARQLQPTGWNTFTVAYGYLLEGKGTHEVTVSVSASVAIWPEGSNYTAGNGIAISDGNVISLSLDDADTTEY